MEYRIGLIHGDGIGPEIVDEAKKVLDAVCEKYGHKFEYTNLLLGGASIDVHGVPLTDETIEEAKKCQGIGNYPFRKGSDGYHHIDEDIALLKELGIDIYRFSISWARLYPQGGELEPNKKGIAF